MISTIFIIIASLMIVNSFMSLEKQKKQNSKKLEAQFLLGSLYFLQYKYHMLQVLELVYEKAAETDEKFVQDYKDIINKIEQKTDQFGEEWFSGLQKAVEHETKYKNWKEVTKYFNEVMKNKDGQQQKTN